MSLYNKPDFWSIKAHKEGYPARSVYKLKEIDEKFSLFRSFKGKNNENKIKILDLGASPGSWSLYALRQIKAQGFFLLAVDLTPISRDYDKGLFDGENFLFLQGDFTCQDIKSAILSQAPFDLILSDAAPSTSGNASVDALRSFVLAESVLEYAESSLVECGNIVIKIFQGSDSPHLLKRIRETFTVGKSFKPQACRQNSFETYYIGLSRHPPARQRV